VEMESPALQVFEYDCPVAVIGDIHGCADLLEELLTKLGPDVPILVVGDLVDRGPDSKRVLDLLVKRKAKGVRGNHEEWFRQWVRGEGFDTFALNPIVGGIATLQSYGIETKSPGEIEQCVYLVPKAHRDLVNRLAVVGDLRVQGETYWMVHAGVSEKVPQEWRTAPALAESLAKFHVQDCLWGTHPPRKAPVLDRPVLMGHLPQKHGPLDLGHVVALDVGAGYPDGYGLAAILLPSREFVVVRSRK